MRILERMSHWPHGALAILEWLGSGGVAVEPELSQARADTCLRCPKHDGNAMLTKPVGEMVRRYLEAKNKAGLKVKGERSLGECTVCCCYMRLKVHEPMELVKKSLTPEEMNGFWENCWIRKEQA